MSRLARATVVVLFVLSLLPLQVAGAAGLAAKPQPPTPTPTITLEPPWAAPVPLPSNCTSGRDSNGSETLVCAPATAAGAPFTATLIIYAHGYVNPYFPAKQIPWDQMSIGGQFISDQVTSMGYYFATTSYRANGLVVQDAIQDLLLVRQIAIDKIHQRYPWLLLGINVIVAGVSEGGLISTLSIERYPGSYKGGLAMCGPIGDFKQQANYWGNFRVLYDAYYPDNSIRSFGGSAIKIPADLIKAWYGDKGVSSVSAAAGDDALVDLAKTKNLLDLASAPYVGSDPQTVRSTVLGLLDYNVYATMNAQAVLGGNPFDNRSTVYGDTSYVPDLRNIVARFAASRTALRNLTKYETTGALTRPLVVLHNIGDPIVPYWHATQYAGKVAAGSEFKLRTSTQAYGHCNFTMDEVVASFGDLSGFITSGNVEAAKSQLSPSQYDEYVGYLRQQGQLK